MTRSKENKKSVIPTCYFVKSTTAHFWYSVERGLWVGRGDATRFRNRADAFAIAAVLRPTEQLPIHRIYVAAVYKRKRTAYDKLRQGVEKVIGICRPCISTAEDGCTGCHIVEELEMLLERIPPPNSKDKL